MTYIQSHLAGQVWFSLGDSITERGWYQPIVTEMLGLRKFVNYGIGGTCIAQKDKDDSSAICLRYKEMGNNPDIITIWGGVNDFGYDFGSHGGIEIGGSKEKTPLTFIGAMHLLLAGVTKQYPLSRIGFIITTPLSIERGMNKKNSKGYYLSDYCNICREVCERYSIPYLDLFKNSGFNEGNIDIMTSNSSGTESDGLHPSKIGMAKIAPKIANFMLSI
ncbi:SGNH/GDSL hydrolase family protein [Xenorhabdus thuongxuanensis]|uniref:Lipase n=1 Tax=Xenorhabdus thuongxuanensis TaxID=1873484 RepID=A0A1Q5TS35_9GAMM|nr:SGNH/GDSL hydrolase family protein [Xenorhabdus thuongxuanensis]OKP03043.1 lipase [Xenorhabdus thuongxuanensis]